MRKFVSPAPVLTTARDTTEVRKGFSEVSKWSVGVLHEEDTFDAATVTLADESSDTSCHILFAPGATGKQPLKTNAHLAFNSETGRIGAALLDILSACTITGWASGYSANIYAKVTGKSIRIYFYITGDSNSTTTQIVFPNALPATLFNHYIPCPLARSNGAPVAGALGVFNVRTVDFYIDSLGNPFLGIGTKAIAGEIFYDGE